VWDADFVAGFDHQTLFDIILASEYLQLRRLIDLACQAIADKIKDKSPREICRIFRN
jgi:S-phase kinase-associated protein 1